MTKSLFLPYFAANRGMIPLHKWDDKHPKSGKVQGKTPRHNNWPARAYSAVELRRAADNGVNLGMKCGDGIAVIDYDARNDGYTDPDTKQFVLNPPGTSFMTFLERAAFPVTRHCRVRTGSGGAHIYVKIPADWRGRKTHPDYPGIDFLHRPGHQVVAADSRHPNGEFYKWEFDSLAITDAQPATAALLGLMTREEVRPINGDTFGEHQPHDMAPLLNQLDPGKFRKYDDWFKLMAAFHWATGGDGRSDFVAWSLSDPKYADDASVIVNMWNGLRTVGGTAITSATFFWFLSEHGCEITQPPQPEASVLFADAGLDDSATLSDSAEDALIADLNSRLAVIKIGARPCILETDVPDLFGTKPMTFQSFRDWLMHKKVRVAKVTSGPKSEQNTKHIEISEAQFFLDHPNRRTYTGLTFRPYDERAVEGDRPGDMLLNAWKGWAFDGSERGPGSTELFRQLLLEGLAQGNQEYYDYVWKWLAFSIQRKSGPQKVALVVMGKKGVGKSVLLGFWASLFGPHGLPDAHPSYVLGKFNSAIAHKRAVVCEEVAWAGDREADGALKGLLTQPILKIEYKGMDSFFIGNELSLAMTTNEEWVVPATRDERRYAVFAFGDKFRGDAAFFDALHAQMDDGGRQALMYELLSTDLTGWRVTEYPQTDAIKEQIARSEGNFYDWWVDLLEGDCPPMLATRAPGGSPGTSRVVTDWGAEGGDVPRGWLRASYLDFCKSSGVQTKEYGLRDRLLEILAAYTGVPVLRQTKRTPPSDDASFLPYEVAGRVDCVRLPPRGDCVAVAKRLFAFEPSEDGDEDDGFEGADLLG